tara:strand:+ start:923 stop:1417 length:495 start_codon:yes stop_codon:yes gene_type:complete
MIRQLNKSCTCKEYSDLELSRDVISKRIKESKKIKKHLEIKSKSDKGHHLYQCEFCNQLWQLSSAWNWGGKDYLFKIPKINIEKWNENPFVSPADMTIFTASMNLYFERHKLIESENICRRENCERKAILKDVLCKKHFIENLQKIGNLPKYPEGKIFEPYTFE